MISFVVDASIVVKWVIEEEGTEDALSLRHKARFIAPDLLAAECSNILWKKVRRGELVKDEALLAAKLLQNADLELLPTRPLLESATRLAVELDHPGRQRWFEEDVLMLIADSSGSRQVPGSSRRRMEGGGNSIRDVSAMRWRTAC